MFPVTEFIVHFVMLSDIAPVFCLTPTRTEKDFLFHLSNEEGVQDLYDVPTHSIMSPFTSSAL